MNVNVETSDRDSRIAAFQDWVPAAPEGKEQLC